MAWRTCGEAVHSEPKPHTAQAVLEFGDVMPLHLPGFDEPPIAFARTS